jgi:hypothetical protein
MRLPRVGVAPSTVRLTLQRLASAPVFSDRHYGIFLVFISLTFDDRSR